MKVRSLFAATALLLCATASVAMDAETFYLKGTALKKKGMGAMFSKDVKPMMAEMQTAVKSVKAENDKAKAAGAPLYCPPAKGKMTAEQLLGEFARIPQSKRKTMSVSQAWREIVINKYPC